MNRKFIPKLNNGYTISVIAHLILLLILAFCALKPILPAKWHSFEWELPQSQIQAETSTAAGLTSSPGIEENPVTVKSKPQTAAFPSKEKEPLKIDSPILETPATTASNETPFRISRSRSGNALRNLGTNLPGGNYGFSASLEQGNGEAYIIDQTKPQIIPTEEGEVFLEFRLTAKGEVDMSSITLLSYSSAAYVESIRKVMNSWRFGFRSTYNPDRKYRIRCNFVINED